MNFGIMIDTNKPIDKIVSTLDGYQKAGIDNFWVSQIFGYDSLTLIGILSQHIKDANFGTAVVPIQPKHPLAMALQAMTVSASMSKEFTLGVGLSHKMVIENIYGLDFSNPATQMEEYLLILNGLISGNGATYNGEHYNVSFAGKLEIKLDNHPKIIVAALGTKMLQIAGRLSDGTATWMTGPATLKSHIVPTILQAAQEAGKTETQIIAGLPICVTDNPSGAKNTAAEVFSIYGSLPSYRSMLDKENAQGPEDVAIIGSAQEVEQRLMEIKAIGATKFIGGLFGTKEEIENTAGLLGELNSKV